ncbi:MAG: hypothetical protein CL824_02850 [Crocinitomicaceae bacterium]|nr:hypothetical protein [Crocinitomicaceae bacterium]
MENNNIDIGKVVLQTLKLIIVKPLTLPWQIYQNSMVSLSNSDNDSSEENVMSSDFPLYVWFVSIFNAMVFITYPLGLIAAIVAAMNAYSNAFQAFLMIIVGTYFIPLYFGLVRELLTVTLKTVYYLKRIANK